MINNTTEHILALPRPVKRLLALSVDALLCALTVWLALCLRLESWVVLTDNQWLAVGLSLALALPVLVASGLYRAIFRYAGLAASVAVIKAMLIYGGLYAAVLAALDLPGVPRTLGMLQPLLLLLAVGASRALARFWLSGAYLSSVAIHARLDGLPRCARNDGLMHHS
jgi:FlaA1/EpsC-like NDP-sugar epimerase